MTRDSKRETRRDRSRSRSPRRKDDHSSRKRKRTRSPARTKPLPFSARLLDKHDFKTYKNLFASYLDIQKQINLDDLPDSEAKGRFKSFIGKWNRGDLAEGWYDPSRLSKEPDIYQSLQTRHDDPPALPEKPRSLQQEDSDSDSDYGPAPALPPVSSSTNRSGPSIPTVNDIAIRREQESESRDSAFAAAKASRLAQAKLEKQRQEELVPRAEPGTRERQLEKKRDLAASNRSFADSKPGAGAAGSGMAEVRDSELMGADEDGIETVKRRKMEEERKLTEREIRREEFARARREEAEERKKEFVRKEDERMERFLRLARERFGES